MVKNVRKVKAPATRKVLHRGHIRTTVKDDGSVEIIASLSGELGKEGKQWISWCPALDLYTCGASRGEALENTKEAIRIFFETCIRHRTLETALLKELGWTKSVEVSVDGLAAPANLCRSPVPPAFVLDKMSGNQWKGHVRL